MGEHCRASRIVARQPHRLGAHELFDLVSLADDQTIGCISSLRGNHASIVTTQNKVQMVLLSNIKQTLREKGVVTDYFGNKVSRKDAVTVLADNVPAPFARVNGTVQQVCDDTLFVVSPEVKSNAGLFAIPAKLVKRLEGRSKIRNQSAFVQEKQPDRNPHPAQLACPALALRVPLHLCRPLRPQLWT